jgi:CHAT domain-containing protein/tetratricopeptide (TPR) repeat protein
MRITGQMPAVAGIIIAGMLAGAPIAASDGAADAVVIVERAASLIEADRYDEALALLAAAQTSADDTLLVRILAMQGRIAADRGRFADARRDLERSLAAATRFWGAGSVHVAPALLGLADIAVQTASAAEVEITYRRCLKSLTASRGTAAPMTSRAAVGLAGALREQGEFAPAEAVLRRYLADSVAAHGPRTDAAGMLTLQLAVVLGLSGRNSESIALFREAAAILEEVHGPDHTHTALGLSGLAHVTSSMGDQDGAAAIYRRCIAIVEARHPIPHPDVCDYRCRLALCLARGATLPEALRIMEQGVAEAAAVFGPDSRQAALEQRQLGLLLLQLERFEDARQVFLRALAVLDNAYGPLHPYLGPCLKGLGNACRRLGLLDEALHYADRAVAVFSDPGGRDQIERAMVLSWKSHVLSGASRHDEAIAVSAAACTVAQAVLATVYQVTSDRETATYANYARMMSQSLLLAYAAHPDPPAEATADVFAVCAQTHGAVVDRLAERQRYLLRAADAPEIAAARTARDLALQRVTDLLVSGSEDDPSAYADRLAALRRTQDVAERALTAAGTRFLDRPADGEYDERPPAESLAAALGPEDLLLHYVYHSRWMPGSKTSVHYGAFRLQPGGGLAFHDLGRAAVIDSLVAVYRTTVEAVRGDARPSARQEAAFRSAARTLHKRLWAPLVPVSKNGIVFVVPARSLYLVDFNTLIDAHDGLVIETCAVHLLSSARDLLKAPSMRDGGRGALVIGDPAAGAAIPCRVRTAGGRPLPGAAQEARAVAALLNGLTDQPVTLLVGDACGEATVKRSIEGKRIAHLATHGFFCDPAARTSPVDPLVLSGLVLTPDVASGNDGLLTAGEVAALDLRGLDWVVLSACSSGLGELVGVDGVFGLRRSFAIAGARTVVMALWRIGDQRLCRVMEDLYRHRLAGAGTAFAVRQAQLARLRTVRDRWGRIHPALWGGIVAEGDWR